MTDTRPRRLLCEERLAICAEAGVSEQRARVLAAADAQRCSRDGRRLCICEQEGQR